MWYVYILRSEKNNSIYIGLTNDLKQRLHEHNKGESPSTKFGIPWELEAYVAVNTPEKARRLEGYFKTGSGKAILRKRILNIF